MSRIQQMSDGSYVRTLSNVERAIIKKLYDEIHNREVAYQELLDRFIALNDTVTVMNTQLQDLKRRVEGN